MMWIEHLLMLSYGWVGGVVSTLLIRHMLDGRRPLDPALLPTAVAVPIAALPALPPAPQLSPYAPKKVLPKPAQRRDALLRVWAAAKQDRSAAWVSPRPPAPNGIVRDGVEGARTVDGPSEPEVRRPLTSELLPSIAWGTPHGGEGVTLTGSSGPKPSAALSGHGAQAPRRRAPT